MSSILTTPKILVLLGRPSGSGKWTELDGLRKQFDPVGLWALLGQAEWQIELRRVVQAVIA